MPRWDKSATASGTGVLADACRMRAVHVDAAAVEFANALTRRIAGLWQQPDKAIAGITAAHDQAQTEISHARRDLLRALAPRHITETALKARRYDWVTYTPEQWLSQATDWASAAQNTRIPFLNVRRLEDEKRFLDGCAPVIGKYSEIEKQIEELRDERLREISATAFGAWHARAREASTQVSGVRTAETTDIDGIPSWRTTGADRAGAGAPAVHVGEVGLADYHAVLRTTSPDSARTESAAQLDVSLSRSWHEYPVVLNLDVAGGFATATREVIEAAVLQLLESVPPGMLRIDAVDPIGLGKSLDFVYGLGDATGAILGDAVWTTADHAAKLLVGLEKHVTFVTQKYLQGQHDTLTAYNLAAGEVAEPYRAVVLFDFPQMFTRDGSTWDRESTARLARLVGAGRRAGVFFFAHTPSGVSNVALDDIPALREDTTFGSPATTPSAGGVTDVRLRWTFTPTSVPDAEARERILNAVVRGLQNRNTTQVLPERITELAARSAAQATARGLVGVHEIAAPDDPASWWGRSSAVGVESRFGRSGATGVASLVFNSEMESAALIGGRPGSGKSFLFHALILDFALNYSPDEIEFYLVDLKEGVEFKQYAEWELPHARAIAIESNREFAVSVLRHVDDLIRARGEKFKAAGGAVVNLQVMRERSTEPMPRVVLMVDEFHKLFEREDALRREAEQLLERIIKEGRAFGVHAILGSQSIALVGASFRSIADQILYRLVLASSESDSRLLLGEGNPDAQLLTRPGEGILNAKSGVREANERFQTSFWEPERRGAMLRRLRQFAEERQSSAPKPFVFEGSNAASVDDLNASALGSSDPRRSLSLLLGSPMSLEAEYTAVLDRAPGRNLLVVDDQAAHSLAVVVADLAAAGITSTLVDFGIFDDANQDLRAGVHRLTRSVSHRKLAESLRGSLDTVRSRLKSERFDEPAQVLILAGLQRARDLVPNSYSIEPDSLDTMLEEVLRDGPETGVFVIALADRPASVERRLSNSALREFGLRLVGTMSADDSRRLVDSDSASHLKTSELLFDDVDRVITRTMRRLVVDRADWLHEHTPAADAAR